MKSTHPFLYILILAISISIYQPLSHAQPGMHMSKMTTLGTKHVFPWTGFFRSLFARKELALGKYPIKLKVSGYILHEPFWDTRQIKGEADGLRLFAPCPLNCDPCGQDSNSVGEFNMSVLETRWRLELYGPKIIGALSFGYLEIDFIGSGVVVDRQRARLAYLKLTWQEHGIQLWAGQHYHPIRLAHIDLDPKVLSRNRGSPIHPTARVPQIRLEKSWDNGLNLAFTALAELEPASFGPECESNVYTRNSLMPIWSLQLWLGDAQKHLCGAGINIKRLVPELVTQACVRTRSTLTSIAGNLFAKISATPLSVRTQLVLAQNAADFDMIGGYAVKEIDPDTARLSYTNINTISYWIDFNADKKISPGLFGGITKILGTGSSIIPCIEDPCTGKKESLIFTRGGNIAYLARLTPRIRFNVKPLIFGIELEWTRAGYGTYTDRGTIDHVRSVNNVRVLMTSFFFF